MTTVTWTKVGTQYQVSDNTSVTVDFDDQSGNVEIDGVSFAHGQSLILDGKKVTVVDI